ncbi:MAG: hypothetical protein MUC62_07390 [Candidatus Thermoplasmatota archaeon]|nr:hypothetical protein [Candidatus Thermoplasmatota archaeon]
MRDLHLHALLIASVMVLTMILPVQTARGNGQMISATRAEGEDMTVVMNLSFKNPLEYTVKVSIEVYTLYFMEQLQNATSLRSIIAAGGADARSELESQIVNWTVNLSSLSFFGDSLTPGPFGFIDESLGPSPAGENGPLLFEATLHGRVEVERYISSLKVSEVDEQYYNELICGFLLSGFRFQRLMTLRSEPGITTTYIIPTRISPYPDGTVLLNVRNTRVPPVGNYNYLTIDGRVGILTGPFDLQMTGFPPVRYESEEIDGRTILDWTTLGTLDITSFLGISSLSLERVDTTQVLPPSVTGPNYLGAGLIRLCFLDGLLDDDQVSEMEISLNTELKGTFETASGEEGLELSTSVDTGTAGLAHPTSGSSLISLLRSDIPLEASIRLKRPLVLDITGEYEEEQVIGLLNGGLRVLRDFKGIDDERTEVEMMMPPGLTFYGEDPKATTPEGRRVFDYEPGYRAISSVKATSYTTEKLSVDVVIDLSDVRSDYFLDVEVMTHCDIEIDLSRIDYDPNDFELNTSIEFELDQLSSDMIRLLLSMGIIDRASVEERLSADISELLEPFIESERQEISLNISDSDIQFDGDTANMDDADPLHISARVEGLSEPFGTKGGGSGQGATNVFVHRHWDPLVPFKTVKRTIVIEDVQKWDPSIKVIFPSGCGVKAWLGNGSDRVQGGLDVKVEGAYPTLNIKGSSQAWDRLYLEISMAGWFGFNNVLVCFATSIGALVLLLLLLVVTIFGKVRKASKKAKEGRADGSESKEQRDGDHNIGERYGPGPTIRAGSGRRSGPDR